MPRHDGNAPDFDVRSDTPIAVDEDRDESTQSPDGGMPSAHVESSVRPHDGGMPSSRFEPAVSPHDGGMPSARVEPAGDGRHSGSSGKVAVVTSKHVAVERETRVQLAQLFIYTSNDDGEPLRDAFVELLRINGIAIADEEPPVRGSWLQRLWMKQDEQTNGKLSQLAGKVERAAELKYIEALKSDNAEHEANAIARLIEAMQSVDQAVILTSSTLFLKADGKLIVQVLTEHQIKILNENPQLQQHPRDLLEALNLLQKNGAEALPVKLPVGVNSNSRALEEAARSAVSD